MAADYLKNVMEKAKKKRELEQIPETQAESVSEPVSVKKVSEDDEKITNMLKGLKSVQENPVQTAEETAKESEVELETKKAGEKKVLETYGQAELYTVQGQQIAYYYVPVTRPNAVERGIINTIKEAATRLISITPYRIRDLEQRRAVYKQRILEILEASPELKIPKGKFEFYAEAVIREMIGYGIIDPLVRDDALEEIMVIGEKKPVYVFHRKYGMMKTNIEFFSDSEITDLVNRIAREIGRRVDFSAPLLDARLPDGSRVHAAINPAAVSGSALTIRKFRKDPYSLIDLIQFKTLNVEAGAFLWLCFEGMQTKPANILISGGTGSGKTTTLNMLCSFVPETERIITIEDSVAGDSELTIIENDVIKKVKIGKLIEAQMEKQEKKILSSGHEVLDNNEDIYTLCFDKNGKIDKRKIGAFIRHKTSKDLYEIALRSGRKIKVTQDHSLFHLNQTGEISPIKTSELTEGSFIAAPRNLPLDSMPIENIRFTKELMHFKNAMIFGKPISVILRSLPNSTLIKYAQGKTRNSQRNTINLWRRSGNIPIKVYQKMITDGWINAELSDELFLKNIRNPHKIPLQLPLTENFLEFIGLWLADGCYDKNSVIVTVEERELKKLVKNIGKEFGIQAKKHSDTFSLMLNSSILKQIMKQGLELDGDSYTKKIPSWVYALNNNQIAAILRGYFSGDGTSGKHEIEWTSCSSQLMNDIQSLLLRLGILSRISTAEYSKDHSFKGRISGRNHISLFSEKIGFIPEHKQKKIEIILQTPTANHDCTDIIPIPAIAIAQQKQLPHYYRSGRVSLGRQYFQTIIEQGNLKNLENLGNNDIFWDEIKEIRKIENKEEFVYDLSMPDYENFICNNVFVHNTAELSLPLKHWVRMEGRPPSLEGKGEISLDILTKNSLRMRPDRIIVGEVRHDEAFTLFTAMNTGHQGSAGTVHANSARETIIRVTNPPMNVPITMLTGLDFIVVQQRIHDRKLGAIRRITEIAEITNVLDGKPEIQTVFEWNPKTDNLERTDLPCAFLKRLSDLSSFSNKDVQDELKERELFLQSLHKKDVREMDAVSKEMQKYLINRINR